MICDIPSVHSLLRDSWHTFCIFPSSWYVTYLLYIPFLCDIPSVHSLLHYIWHTFCTFPSSWYVTYLLYISFFMICDIPSVHSLLLLLLALIIITLCKEYKLWCSALCNFLLTHGTIKILRGQFQNQPPIGWLKKYKTENKALLYGTVTHITALLLHIAAVHI
jgi:hypothetical protein